MSKPEQLFLLADHIKLTLLERQRSRGLLGVENDAQDGVVARSLDQFRNGIALLEQEQQQARLNSAGQESATDDALVQSIPTLRKQLDSLVSQFHGFTSLSDTDPSDPPLSLSASDSSASSNRKPKTVRFNDSGTKTGANTNPTASSPAPAQELFGRYRDDPDASPGYSDQASAMSNQELHQYHSQILQEQDDHLDRLGESIGRQRELSMQIGDELESHVAMLDEVDGVVDRHQSRLDRARRSMNRVAKAAAENKQMTLILVLIVVLVLLIAVLK